MAILRKAKNDIASLVEAIVIRKSIKKAIKYLNNMKGSVKTTAYGIIAAFGVIIPQLLSILDGDPATNPDMKILVGAVITILGLLGIGFNARDKDVSTEAQKAAGTKMK